MRLLYVIDSLAPGGAETSLAELAPGLVNSGMELHVLALGHRLDLAEKLERAGAIVHLPAHRQGRWGNLKRVIEVAKSVNPGLIHTTLFEADIAGRTAASILRIPSSTSIVNDSYNASHYSETNTLKLHAARLLDAGTCQLAQRFHAITDVVANNVSRRLGISRRKVHVIPRGRDPKTFPFQPKGVRSQLRKELGIRESAQVILAVGRQEPQKGLHHLLDAIPTVACAHPDLIVLLAGKEGRSTEALREQSQAIDSDVRFLGHRIDIANLLAASDVFCFPSEREGFGGVLIEAMAVGCPVVASDIPTSVEVLTDDDALVGVITPVGDRSALSSALQEVLSNPVHSSWRTARAREHFEDHFTIESSTAKMITFFKSVSMHRHAVATPTQH